MAEKIALVTGANKGLGFAVVKGLCEKFKGIVYLTSRDEKRGLQAVQVLKKIGLNPQFHVLDVTNEDSAKKFADFLKNKHGGIDVLVNNAGVMDLGNVYPTYEGAKHNIDVNYRGLVTVEKFLYPLLRDGAKVVNVSSACGLLSNLKNEKWLRILKNPDLTEEELNDFVEEYLASVKNGTFRKENFADEGKHAEHRVSKIAATALTMVQQRNYASRNISINAIHPGHIKTDMAKGGGDLEPEEAAKGILFLILEASPNLKGTFVWHDGKLIDWYDNESNDYYKYCP
ncbi:carbonyl reductase [NADPH] 1-like [Hyposmocoma kahamanoa]|uniref:carbonyl reductase [NADPH] 1-like n=1 Tax=Hyposmocoma kahamanoa TaxID=1477025 RepID=UPI000E6D6806|nr:carbonyl reductase [NADPH] 1-like [Hyposmocoma kahamanoa]